MGNSYICEKCQTNAISKTDLPCSVYCNECYRYLSGSLIPEPWATIPKYINYIYVKGRKRCHNCREFAISDTSARLYCDACLI